MLQKPTLTVRITFNLIDPALDSEELEAKTQTLRHQRRGCDAVKVDRGLVYPLAENKTLGAFLSGLFATNIVSA